MTAVAQAALITTVYSSLGSNHYSAAVELVNDGSPAEITGFTLYFSEALFSNLALDASPATWDSLVIQPDPGIPGAGFLDAFVLDVADALQTGQSQAGFTVTFDFIGQGAPGSLPFDIVDFDYRVLFSGQSTSSMLGNQVPEPAVGWLLLAGLSLVAYGRRRATEIRCDNASRMSTPEGTT